MSLRRARAPRVTSGRLAADLAPPTRRRHEVTSILVSFRDRPAAPVHQAAGEPRRLAPRFMTVSERPWRVIFPGRGRQRCTNTPALTSAVSRGDGAGVEPGPRARLAGVTPLGRGGPAGEPSLPRQGPTVTSVKSSLDGLDASSGHSSPQWSNLGQRSGLRARVQARARALHWGRQSEHRCGGVAANAGYPRRPQCPFRNVRLE